MNAIAEPTPVVMGDTDSDSWCTPKDLARMLGHFDLDPCSNSRSHINADYTYSLQRGRDGLRADWWEGSVFVNPPYSNPLPWAKRLAKHEGPWVALMKLDPTTRWYATLLEACTGMAPFRARLKFERPDKKPITANFPSLLVWHCWKPSAELASHLWLPKY